jgi:hypothetical protein
MYVYRREEGAASRASRWLTHLTLDGGDTESELRRLFGLWAADVVRCRPPDGCHPYLLRPTASLRRFQWREYSGDPVLALAVHAVLHDHGAEHEDLAHLATAYADITVRSARCLGGELPLVADLLRCCGLDVPRPTKVDVVLPAAEELVSTSREQVLETCRRLTLGTSCGRRGVVAGDLAWALPSLAVSFAMDWDIEAVCRLVRSCVYLGLQEAHPCRLATEWLLGQQQRDGRFGFLAPEARRAGRDPDDWQPYLLRTVEVLWTLAEVSAPGFMVSCGDPSRTLCAP